ncbi:MAG: tellurite resistance TerB family protein [Pseudomonadota bacterium]
MLDDLIRNSIGTQGQTGAGNTAAGSGFDLDSLLTGRGGLATGLAAGGLAGLLLGGKKPKKLAKNALKFGGVALVGGLAYKAYSDWRKNNQQAATAPAPSEDRFLPTGDAERNQLGCIIARAMVASAHSDGHIDADERTLILGQLNKLDMDDSLRSFLTTELREPASIDDVVAEARTPEIAAEIYTASVIAAGETNAAENAYLALLAARLDLDPGLVEQIHLAVAANALEPA